MRLSAQTTPIAVKGAAVGAYITGAYWFIVRQPGCDDRPVAERYIRRHPHG
ncbi:MAG: hypothetical protein WA633_12850 [Stellaceae bacterium]